MCSIVSVSQIEIRFVHPFTTLKTGKGKQASKDMPATHTLRKTPTRVQNQTSFPSLPSLLLPLPPPSLLCSSSQRKKSSYSPPPPPKRTRSSSLSHSNSQSKTNIPTLINHSSSWKFRFPTNFPLILLLCTFQLSYSCSLPSHYVLEVNPERKLHLLFVAEGNLWRISCFPFG
ncbi:hypothetical protein B9Z19DRAFT_790501 [Tuber borchii]|uniref:Uncharacterized protein n=1 Tax=Tuber borchii TaxID=42251 RepID=A0A2T6ZWH0_TUBBO|nr:hypothetical protein B9Z19DRAFT_790501 [Tuber borchii]